MRKKSSPQSPDQDWKIVLLFLLSFLVILILGFWVGIGLLVFALFYSSKAEYEKEVHDPETAKHTYAGFWVRTGSLFVDGAFSSGLLLVMIPIFGTRTF